MTRLLALSRPAWLSAPALLALAAGMLAWSSPVLAQVPPTWRTSPPTAPTTHDWLMQSHRQDLERLRQQADRRDAFTRQIQNETRDNLARIEGSRPVAPPAPSLPVHALGDGPTPAEARARGASAIRETPASGQIEDWLARAPR